MTVDRAIFDFAQIAHAIYYLALSAGAVAGAWRATAPRA